ncbi:hypothetical protein [Flavobacterium pectinovorum]|uniref:Uncharacterized protein n=1 Tax=Flavobacterium pectinovorum TaxID=29533 RepID=A0A502E843_9FLAO|nr:hypothetical protein [Flavobacterium pectinovorum]TPG33908.1 hypothetical protein EAH81_23455 [Flavobacterium pectinovorum]
MKTIRIKIVLAIVVAGLALSCKKNETAPTDYNKSADSTTTQIDTVGPNSDTTSVGAGTTGATGEGSTGSGSAGTTQKGNTTVKTDSTSTNGR